MRRHRLSSYASAFVLILAVLSMMFQAFQLTDTLMDDFSHPSASALTKQVIEGRANESGFSKVTTSQSQPANSDLIAFNEVGSFHRTIERAGSVVEQGQVGYDLAKSKSRKILYFNRFWHDPSFRFALGGPEVFEKASCAVTACETAAYQSIRNKSAHDFDQYDAVVFSIEHVDLNLDNQTLAEINTWRKPHHRFILFGYENPGRQTGLKTHFNGFFNWTLAYRTDSDIRYPYGWFTSTDDPSTKIRPQYPKEWITYNETTFMNEILPKQRAELTSLARRPKKVAWLVSSCRLVTSKRSQFVAELAKHIDIDIMGLPASRNARPCHPNTIPCDKRIGKGPDNCTVAIQRDYKFYLSFENSLCDDYVTEKVYDRIENSLIITMNQANMSKLVPPHSSVSIFDFDSPKALADFMHYLDKNETAYMSYFWWKEHYKVHSLYRTDAGFCSLCERLHEEERKRLNGTPSPLKVYDDMLGWWWKSGECSRMLPTVELMIAKG